jgi:predicted dehydrogenase
MGKSHSMAYRNVTAVYRTLPLTPRLALVCEENENLALRAAETFGFEDWSNDWRSAVTDQSIDLVDIVTPNFLHKEMAIAAAKAGKHVYCEKPLAPTAADAKEMYEAAESAGISTLVGFNFLWNPAIAFARELIEAGELGEIHDFKGTLSLDALVDDTAPFSWRFDAKLAGAGALGDTGSHVIAFARALVGDIQRVCGLSRILVKERPATLGGGEGAVSDALQTYMRVVENDDATIFLCEFTNGASGTIEASQVATGRKHDLSVEVTGTKGALRFDQQRGHELLLYLSDDPNGRQGFRSVTIGPEHGDHGNFWSVSGLNLRIHELKVIEVHALLIALNQGRVPQPGFREGWQVCRVIDVVRKSVEERRWVEVSEV